MSVRQGSRLEPSLSSNGRSSSTHDLLLLGSAIATGCLVGWAAAGWYYHRRRQEEQLPRKKRETDDEDEPDLFADYHNDIDYRNDKGLPMDSIERHHKYGRGVGLDKEPVFISYPPELRQEQLSRHVLYFGDTGMTQIQQARICVVGLGGVGSHAAHMLARGGVGFLRLIDFDQVTLSSLNRHACAVLADVGIPKATCLVRFLRQICPDPSMLQLDARVVMYTEETGPSLLSLDDSDDDTKWDLVIDAIDDVPTKAALLSHCLQRRIPVISCMGAGGKSDVTRLHISDLRTAAKDPLASKLRQQLKKVLLQQQQTSNADSNTDSTLLDASYLEDMDQLSIVYSSEKPVVKLADFTDEQKAAGVHHFGAVDGMRIRVLPVLGTTPAVMGQTLATWALCRIGGKPFQPVTGERVGRAVRHKLLQLLHRREKAIVQRVLVDYKQGTSKETDSTLQYPPDDLHGQVVGTTWIGPVLIDMDDVEYLLEIWRNRCAVTGARLGTVLELVRWDESRPSTCDNLVLMSKHALARFDSPHGKENIPETVRASIEERLATCRMNL
jgi:tRNA threonylcarbamoyladenosine dehydratase